MFQFEHDFDPEPLSPKDKVMIALLVVALIALAYAGSQLSLMVGTWLFDTLKN